MKERRDTYNVNVGGVVIGSSEPVRIQSMTNTPTEDSLATANTEITALQAQTAGVSASAIEESGSVVGGDWNGYYIQDANFRATVEEVHDNGNVSSSQNVNWTNGHYQRANITSDGVVLTLSDWPATGKLGKLRLEISSDDSRTVRINAAGMKNDGNVAFTSSDGTSVTLTLNDTDSAIVDFWTADQGLPTYASYVGTFN